ncbi:MAG: TIGR01777 family oxidoreductase [bacterium]
MNIAITGGSGFIGTALAHKLLDAGHQVTIYDRVAPRFSHERMQFVSANLVTDAAPTSIANHNAIVHLAGVSIYERWTAEYKQQIMESRTKSTASIVDACRASEIKPTVFVCASAVGYYGDQTDRILDESASTPTTGTDFLSDVCVAWESAAQKIEELGIRRVSVRTAIVLGPGGGMMSKLLPIFKWGLGGRLGNGNQWFSWIHIDDLIAIYYEAITNMQLSGPVNATAPEPVTNRVFTKSLGKALHRPAFLIIPAFALRIILGEFAKAVLASTRAVPAKLQVTGFEFTYKTIDEAMETFLGK